MSLIFRHKNRFLWFLKNTPLDVFFMEIVVEPTCHGLINSSVISHQACPVLPKRIFYG